ncbi:hypothetical protein N7540_007383 [Penicillium herquei]|nr:hypothetical protein N7540_007383 [Penicillium herquei]
MMVVPSDPAQYNFIKISLRVLDLSEPEDEVLQDRIEAATKKGYVMLKNRTLTVDPAACPSGGMFRDAVRRQLGMPSAGVDFLKLNLL